VIFAGLGYPAGTVTERDKRISPTAHYTAYVWHRLRLPYADLFATPTGRTLFWSFRAAGEWMAAASPGLPSMVQYLELRHRAIEHALDQIEPDRIVEIGAGLSRRGVTWVLDRGVQYTEVDLPHMVEAKRAVLRRHGLAQRLGDRLTQVAKDALSPDFGAWLGEHLVGAQRPVVITEGVLGYFELPERERIARSIAEGLAAVGRGTFLSDLRSNEGGRTLAVTSEILKGAIWLITRGRGAAENFVDADDVRGFFARTGFATAEPVPTELATPHLVKLRSPARVWRAEVTS
jgi:O-methyltransferase involved in polyketide biosynthesis